MEVGGTEKPRDFWDGVLALCEETQRIPPWLSTLIEWRRYHEGGFFWYFWCTNFDENSDNIKSHNQDSITSSPKCESVVDYLRRMLYLKDRGLRYFDKVVHAIEVCYIIARCTTFLSLRRKARIESPKNQIHDAQDTLDEILKYFDKFVFVMRMSYILSWGASKVSEVSKALPSSPTRKENEGCGRKMDIQCHDQDSNILSRQKTLLSCFNKTDIPFRISHILTRCIPLLIYVLRHRRKGSPGYAEEPQVNMEKKVISKFDVFISCVEMLLLLR
ncbi:hypothetical protein Sjap_005599 [Stephania japonica]|uniref:Uncharacterized protein n=1 Tax=Stephania japonica TaxID=461633 RepID=A0AAP0K4A3_9MAGN